MGDRLGTAGVVGFFFFFFHHDFIFTFFFPHWHHFFRNSLGVFTHILHTKSHCCKAATAYDHTTLSTPVPVWSLKLSRVEPAQYLDGWPPQNSRCCRLLFFFFHHDLSFTFFFPHWHHFFFATHWECSHIFCTQNLIVVRQLLPTTIPHWVHQFPSDHLS